MSHDRDIEQRQLAAYAQAFRQGAAHACATLSGLNGQPIEQAIAHNYPNSQARALIEQLTKGSQA